MPMLREAPVSNDTYEILALKYAERLDRHRAESFMTPEPTTTPPPIRWTTSSG